MDKNEQRVCWYSSVLIVLMVNSPKLLSLRPNGIMARLWHFNLAELLFQQAFNLFFCWLVFYLNLQPRYALSAYRDKKQWAYYWAANVLLFLAFTFIGGTVQEQLFPGNQLPFIYLLGTFARLGLSGILILILIRILLLIRESKRQELENEHLKSVYMLSELELLKEQMNPHFLFNALSSLSGVIREDPDLAQKYVRELSNVFRYALKREKANLVPLEEELAMLNSFAQLVKMRLENAFCLYIDLDERFLQYKLPHLSMQPLLENAIKHNAATVARPLTVKIYMEGDRLVVSNTLWEIPLPETSNGLGLANLNERYRIMMHDEIELVKTTDHFMVKLPLLV